MTAQLTITAIIAAKLKVETEGRGIVEPIPNAEKNYHTKIKQKEPMALHREVKV